MVNSLLHKHRVLLHRRQIDLLFLQWQKVLIDGLLTTGVLLDRGQVHRVEEAGRI